MTAWALVGASAREPSTPNKQKKTNKSQTQAGGAAHSAALPPDWLIVGPRMLSGPMARVMARDPFPPSRRYSLSYGNVFSLSGSGTGNVYGTAQSYRLNSLFDPDLTGSGTQPYGYDQITPIYNLYKVLRATVELDAENTSTSAGTLTLCVVPSAVSLPTLAAANVDAFLDKPFCWSSSIGAVDANGPLKFRQSFDIGALDGLTPLQFHADKGDYSASITANPAAQVRLTMAVAPATSAALIANVKVRITFDCVFWDRTILAQS